MREAMEAYRRVNRSKSTLFIFTGRRCEDGCFRIEKTRDYTVMSNHHLKDRTLTLKSKGLLSMMLSLPDEWNYTTRGLAAICREGVDSIGAALKELENYGYIRRTQLRDEKARSRIPSMSFTKCLSASRRQAQIRLYRVRQSHIRKTRIWVSRIRRNRVRKTPHN